MNLPDNDEPEIHIEPEFQLILVDPGPAPKKVIILVRQLLKVSPAEARHRVQQGEVTVAEELSYFQITELQTRFESLGAVVRIE